MTGEEHSPFSAIDEIFTGYEELARELGLGPTKSSFVQKCAISALLAIMPRNFRFTPDQDCPFAIKSDSSHK